MAELERLARRLGEPLVRTGEHRGLHYLVTPRARWIVKPVYNLKQSLWWEISDWLIRKNGFRSMPPFFIWEKKWLVMRYVSGRPAHYRYLPDLKRVARLLARFHLAARNVQPVVKRPPAPTLMERLINRLEQFAYLRTKLYAYPALRAAGDDFLRFGEQAIRQLEQTALNELIQFDIASGAIAHRDLASHNIIIDKNGAPWLIDFETAAFDVQLGDVWQLASRALVEWGWEADVYLFILHHYEAIRPLRKEERDAITQLFWYPNDFFRETLGILNDKKRFAPQKVLPYLYGIVRQRKRWQSFLTQSRVTW